MPTGYTDSLEKSGWNVKKWLKEDAIRALGVCVAFRDHGKMTEAQIIAGLKEAVKTNNNDNYYEKELVLEEANLKLFKGRSRKEWQAVLDSNIKEAKKRLDDEIASVSKTAPKYQKAVEEIKALRAKSKVEAVHNLVDFALEQLEMVEDEYEVSKHTIDSYERISLLSLDQFIMETTDGCISSIAYYKREIAERKARDINPTSRLDFYLQVVKECDKYL